VFSPHPTPSDAPKRHSDRGSLRPEERRSAVSAPQGGGSPSTFNTSAQTVGARGRAWAETQVFVASDQVGRPSSEVLRKEEHPTKSDALQLRTRETSLHAERARSWSGAPKGCEAPQQRGVGGRIRSSRHPTSARESTRSGDVLNQSPAGGECGCPGRAKSIRRSRTPFSSERARRACMRSEPGAGVAPRRGAEPPSGGLGGESDRPAIQLSPGSQLAPEMWSTISLVLRCDGPPPPSHRSPAAELHHPHIEALLRTSTALTSKPCCGPTRTSMELNPSLRGTPSSCRSGSSTRRSCPSASPSPHRRFRRRSP